MLDSDLFCIHLKTTLKTFMRALLVYLKVRMFYLKINTEIVKLDLQKNALFGIRSFTV